MVHLPAVPGTAAAVATEQGPARPGKAALGEQNRCAASAGLLGPHRPVMSGRGPGPIVDLRRLGVHSGRPGWQSTENFIQKKITKCRSKTCNGLRF
eukprot:COSAG01_NODE_33847_length_557_cov_1.268559_1_plen_95_part_01